MIQPRSILFLSAGLDIDGGIASVSRSVTRALEEEVVSGSLERVDRVLLRDNGGVPMSSGGEQYMARGHRLRFAWLAWRSYRKHRNDLVLLDHVGLGRALELPFVGHPLPHAVFVYGRELAAGGSGARGRERVIRNADRVLTISDFMKDRIGRRFPEVEGRIVVVPLCIDGEKLREWDRLPATSQPPETECAVIITSRIIADERGKGHDALLDAWTNVKRAAPAAKLWIVGRGDDTPRLQAKASDLGLEDVRFFGWVSDRKLGELYRRASVFAMPSRQEGFGLVYAEAMWHGLPCIGSTADAARDVIVDGKTGRLVSYGDPGELGEALVQLLSDRKAARRMGELGRQRIAAEFTYENFRSSLLSALGVE